MLSKYYCLPSHDILHNNAVIHRVANEALNQGILLPPNPEILRSSVNYLFTNETNFSNFSSPYKEIGISVSIKNDFVFVNINLEKISNISWNLIDEIVSSIHFHLLLTYRTIESDTLKSLSNFSFEYSSLFQRPYFFLTAEGIYLVEDTDLNTAKHVIQDPKDIDILNNFNFNSTANYIHFAIKTTHSNEEKKDILFTILKEDLLREDTLRAQLPPLDKGILEDSARGIWNAYWPSTSEPDPQWYVRVELDEAVEAANPWESVRHGSQVAIDFGTSSTVAAVREEDGSLRLLRIGGELQGKATSMQYENPTALEFSDYQHLVEAWLHEPWRPMVLWEDIKCSHQARHELTAAERASCGMRSIKTWAREQPGSAPLRLCDEKHHSFELSPLPVIPDEAMNEVGDVSQRSVDPIELYAFFLGLSLNNQVVHGGTIYPRYYLTFPVKFDRCTRDRILQGFRRGLLRSMPASLVYGQEWRTHSPFSIKEMASEPTAFAAGVLPQLAIKPTEEGEAFGVFDFGGGTTDFAFGLYRCATLEESENEGWENVLDILDVAGDELLGGEHLLDLVAHQVIRDNIAVLLDTEISFHCPQGLRPFDGSEMLFMNSADALANTVVLREAMRPLWEEGRFADDETGTLTLNFTKRDGEAANGVKLQVNADALRDLLKDRIRQGVRAFFTTFRQAFKMHELRPEKLHVLLAGNSCRSPLVQEVFEENIREILPEEHERIVIHQELLPREDENEQQQTSDSSKGSIDISLKTGVAIGLLHLLPGEPTGVVERNRRDAESPFLFTVGLFRNDVLQPVLERNAAYGQWQRFPQKVVRSGVTKLGYSSSPLALENEIRRTQCRERNIEWGPDLFGRRICVRADDPHHISVALEVADSSIDGDIQIDESTLRTIELLV